MPPKFDDLSKIAADVLNEDHQTSGYVLKAKQKASYGGAVLSTQVDLFGKDGATPAKLTWKWPKPLGCPSLNIDKLEMDKSGKFKCEVSSDKAYPGLKLDAKSDLCDVGKIMCGATYTGIADTQLKCELKAINPQSFTCEVTHTRGVATCGMKVTDAVCKGGTPDIGVKIAQGPFVCSVLAKEKFSAYTAHCYYKANDDLKVAATYQHGGKGNGNCALGVAYKNLGKIRCTQDQTISCTVKHSLAKGTTILAGCSYNIKKGNQTCGLQLSIE